MSRWLSPEGATNCATIFMNTTAKNVVLIAAFVSVPLTLHGVLTDSAFHITAYGYIGGAPTVSGSSGYNLSVGYNNLFTNSFYSAMIGYGLQSYDHYSLAVGIYNASSAGLRFAVGNGVSTSVRRNAFEVVASGNVNVPISTVGAKFTVGTNIVPLGTVTTKIYGTADIASVPAKGGVSMGAFNAVQ